MLWEAFNCETPSVVLIDEIDKADIEFPNDLLRELDRMEFYVYETRQLVKARHHDGYPAVEGSLTIRLHGPSLR